MSRVFELVIPNATAPFSRAAASSKVFLAGSIEMGGAVDWQDAVVTRLKSLDDLNIVVYNPRRDDWDSSWVQDPTPGTEFHKQVSWEQYNIKSSDIVYFYFAPGTISPISLLELGQVVSFEPRVGYVHGQTREIVVCCPPEFQRYGNVKMVCSVGQKRHDIHFTESFSDSLRILEKLIIIDNHEKNKK